MQNVSRRGKRWREVLLNVGLVLISVLGLCTLLPTRGVQAARADDQLTITIANSDTGDGTYTLTCHPTGGDHPNAQAACDQLDALTTTGVDPFAPVPSNAQCTLIYGGPQTAHVTGSWAGRPVDANFQRTNGCEISRWDKLSSMLNL